LKRRRHSDQARPSEWLRAVGKGPADWIFRHDDGQRLKWVMAADEMAWILTGSRMDLQTVPTEGFPSPFYPEFIASDTELARTLTEFYLSHGSNFGPADHTAAEWAEWIGLILNWAPTRQRTLIRNQLLNMNMTAEGYVWTWGIRSVGWPFPFRDDTGDGLNNIDTRHFTTNSAMVLGTARHYSWTRDEGWLRRQMPRVRRAMAYQLNQLQGRNGVLIGNSKDSTGRPDAVGSNYWDILPFGHKDAFANIYFFASLGQMAALEEEAARLGIGGTDSAPAHDPRELRRISNLTRQRFNETFWDESLGRYIGCVDIDGNRHDYGFTFINLEAMGYGLASPAQVRRIYDWMENGITSSGKADTYSAFVFAPRANTIDNPGREEPQEPKPSWWYLGWGGVGYGLQCQDGGAILYTSAFDLWARSRFLGADNADRRLREILGRYRLPDRLSGGSPVYTGETTQGGPGGGPGAVGIEGEFPESGMVPTAFLYTVIGVSAEPGGLRIRPNLPSSLEWAGVRRMRYGDRNYEIRVTRTEAAITPEGGRTTTHPLRNGEVFFPLGSGL
jgi:hypothetical protein